MVDFHGTDRDMPQEKSSKDAAASAGEEMEFAETVPRLPRQQPRGGVHAGRGHAAPPIIRATMSRALSGIASVTGSPA